MEKNLYIHIALGKHQLSLCCDGELLRRWPCAVGKAASPTPAGRFKIVSKVFLDNTQIYGSRWLGLDLPRYGIHGTNDPASIGRDVSLGCIRMHNKDVDELCRLVPAGTPVNITP
jgi:lipoprotein-anchoring transpeptidase ErfK/SrfK